MINSRDGDDSLSNWLTLRQLCAFYVIRRIALGRMRACNRKMSGVRSEFYKLVWREAAMLAEARFTSLRRGMATIERCGRKIEVSGCVTSLDAPEKTLQLRDKAATRTALVQAGIPVPRHVSITLGRFQKALDMLRASGGPLVVKPANNTGSGAGVSTNVTSEEQLYSAVAWARAFGPQVIVEEQIAGDCYRVLVMDGEVLDIVVRHPPSVTGDGVCTVRQLLRRENQERLELGAGRAQVLIRIDPDLRNTLARQGLTLESRPAKSKRVILKGVINDNNCLENVSGNSLLCPDILNCALKAAGSLSLRLGGVDLICTDPTIDLSRSGGAVLEVNANPGFYYHYCRVGEKFPAADYVLRRFFQGTTN